MRNIDRRAISRYHVPGLLLMENAGRAVVEHMLDDLEELDAAAVAIVCGKGNNGGDGFVVARHLHHLGHTPAVFLIARRDEVEGDAATNLRIVERLPIPLYEVPDSTSWRSLAEGENPLEIFDVVVDALLGTGLKGRVRGDYEAIVRDINGGAAHVVSVDVPSGLSGDSVEVKGAAVRAHATVTFEAPKLPHLFPPAEAFCGNLVISRIGIPNEAVETEEICLEWVDEDVLEGMLPPRPDASHKGDYGHVLVLGGSTGKAGAVRLTGEATLMSGAGLVTAAVPKSVRAEVAAHAPLMTEPLAETGQGELSRRAVTPLRKMLADKSVLAVGMGAGRGKEMQATLRSLVIGCQAPVVLDADGLNAFVGHDEKLTGQKRPLVVTPHPGEMARLAGISTRDVQRDRIGICRRFAMSHTCHVVLKGYRTLVGTPEGKVFANPTGNPGLATAGAGDALTGVLAGLISAGLPVTDALILGVFSHGLAADLAAEKTGLMSLTASSLLESLPEALRQVEDLAS
jgi:NAD(P)H-hydrate epimerase